MAQATVTKTVRLSEGLADGLEAAAEATGHSENKVVNLALTVYLAKLVKEGTLKIDQAFR